MNHRILVGLAAALLFALPTQAQQTHPGQAKTSTLASDTPAPRNFVVHDSQIIRRATGQPAFFKGIGYSPYLPGETPLYGDPPGNDQRYREHLGLIQDMGANYLHVFPMMMPANFFTALDATDLVYGQDIWVWPYEEDFLAEPFLAKTLNDIKSVIDHTYQVGRPDRLVLFSIGDELQAASVARTNTLHPNVHDFTGKHIEVKNRTATEIALARLIDGAMDYELSRYGQRHLYCHTSWTHIGPVAARPDLEVAKEDIVTPDLGDLICLNVYTYARGVRTSPPGSVTGSSYQGYLEELADQASRPIFITQVGFSTSPFEPKPWVPGFGGHKVEDVAGDLKAIWRDLHTAKNKEKFAGISFFELNDEWWKSGEDPTDANRHEQEDPEEWFGIYAVGADHRLVPKGELPATLRQLFSAETK
ncbi:MAG: hypothetical protein ACK5PS_07950 [Desulfopila sp.]